MNFEFLDKKPQQEQENIIYIIRNSWNDYGKNVTFDLSYEGNNLGQIKILKVNQDETWKSLEKDNLVNKKNELGPKLDGYYSLASDDTYKNLYHYISNKNDVKNFLNSINDIAYDDSLITHIKNEAAYKEAFMRGVNEAYIKNTLQLIANGHSTDKFKISVSYSPEFDKDFDFDFDRTELIPTNLHAIVGKNGVGKSRLLRDITAAIINNTKGKSEFIKYADYPQVEVNFGEEEKIGLSNVIYISLSPFDEYSNKFKEIATKVGNLNNSDNKKVTNYIFSLNNTNSEVTKKVFDQLEKIKNKKNYRDMLNVINENFNWDFDINRFFDEKISDYQYDDSQREKVKALFKKMSSGQKNIIIILIMVLVNILENSLLIIDEPENYLHPPYIASLISTLLDILQITNGAGIVATHSDIVLQELPSKCIHILENKKFKTLNNFQTYGNSLDAINEKVFGVDMEKTGFYSRLRRIKNTEDKSKCEALLKNNKLGMQAQIYLSVLMEEEKD